MKNGYTIVFRRMLNDEELEPLIPIFIDFEQQKMFTQENPLIEFAIKKLEVRLSEQEQKNLSNK